ncbi:hypothetical protein GGF31_000497 [Allomyces arbusculus]|nr:hypothetical protein GGF31_000497 [Allomyces arbusculus]
MPGNPDLLREYVATQRALVAHGRSGAPSWPGSSPPSAAVPAPAAAAAPAPAPPPARPTSTTRRFTAVRRIVSLDIVADHYGVDDIDVHSSVSQARTRKRIDAPRPFPPPPAGGPDGEEDGGGMGAVRAAVKDQRRERRRAQSKPERQVANAKKAVAKRDGKKKGKYGDVKVLETFLEQAKLAPSHRLTVPKGIFDKAKARSAPAAAPAPAVPADLAAIATHEPGIGRHLPKARDRDREAAAAAASRSRSRSRDRNHKSKDKERKSNSKRAREDRDEDEGDVENTGHTRGGGGGATSRENYRGRRAHALRPARRNPDRAPPRRVKSPMLFDDENRTDEAKNVLETDAHGAQEPSPTPPPAPRRSLRISSARSVPATTQGGHLEPAHVVSQGTSTAGDRITRRDVAPVRSAVPAKQPAAGMVDAAVQMSPQSIDNDHPLDEGKDNQDHYAADRLIIAHPPPLSSHAEWPAWMEDAEIAEPDAWPHLTERTEMSPTAGLIRELEDATRTVAGSGAQFMEMFEDGRVDMEKQPAEPAWGAAWDESADDVMDKLSEVDWREPLYLSGLVPRPPLPSSMTYPHVAQGGLSEYTSSWDVAMGDEADHEYELTNPTAQASWNVSYETSQPMAWAHFPWATPGSPIMKYAGSSRIPGSSQIPGSSRILLCSQPLPSTQVNGWADVPRIEAPGRRRPLPPSRSAPEAALAFRYRKHRLY